MKLRFPLLLLAAVFSLFLIQGVSAAASYGEWQNGNANIVIANGQSATFNVDFFTINPPMTVNVKLFSQDGILLNAFESSRQVTGYGFSGNYTVTQAMYQGIGLFTVALTASDSFSSTDTYVLTLSVGGVPPTNNAPAITSVPVNAVNENAAYLYDVNATDADGDALVYSLSTAPSWLTINQYDGRITGTAPSVTANTAFPIVVNVTDGFVSTTQSYTLTVNNVIVQGNNAPTITSTPSTSVNESTTYSYQVTATDADNDALTYSLTQAPTWLSINSATGLLSGTSPLVTADTAFNVMVSVSDGNGGTATQTYILTVNNDGVVPPGNNPPVITSTPSATSVNENATHNYQVMATDADGDTLTYSVIGPTWLSISSSGLLTGTAPSVTANTAFNVTVSISDGNGGTATQTYILTVLNVSTPNPPSGVKRGGGGVRFISDGNSLEEQQYLSQFTSVRTVTADEPSVSVRGGFSFATLFWIIVFILLAVLIVWLIVRLVR